MLAVRSYTQTFLKLQDLATCLKYACLASILIHQELMSGPVLWGKIILYPLSVNIGLCTHSLSLQFDLSRKMHHVVHFLGYISSWVTADKKLMVVMY